MKQRKLKSVLCLVLTLVLLIVPFCPVSAASEIVQILNVTVDGARVRDEDREIITSLSAGTKVFYMNEKSGSTSLIRASNGVEGYVYDEFLEFYGAVKLDSIYYCTVGNKSVYRIADENDRKIGTIVADQYVVVLRTRGNWAFVKGLNGKGGFCTLDGLVKAT